MGNPTKENIFRGLLGAAATAATFFATGGTSPWLAVIAGLGSELAGEQASHFIQKGYHAICGNNVIKQHILKAMQAALKDAVKDIEQDWRQQKQQLPKKAEIDNFLHLFTEIGQKGLAEQYFNIANTNDIFALVESNSQTGEATLNGAVSYQFFADYWKEAYTLTDDFIQFFNTRFFTQFNAHVREAVIQGDKAKNALDLLYQQTFRTQLTEILEKIDSNTAKLDTFTNALPQIIEQLAASGDTLQTDALTLQLATALKKVLAKQHDDLLEYTNPQPLLEYDYTGLDVDNVSVFRQRYLNFVKQPEIWQQLTDFYEKDSQLEWWIITGPTGSGKSRLALEFCIELHRQSACLISGGFMRVEVFKTYDWGKNRPERPWLIIIDYACAHKESIERALTHLVAARNDIKHKVRLLLLDRTVSTEWFEETPLHDKLGESEMIKKLHLNIQGGALAPYQPKPLEIATVNDSFAIAIFKDTLAKLDCTIDDAELLPHLNNIAKIDPLLRPLFVFFCASAVAEGQDIRQWNTNNLMHYWLERHEKPRWKMFFSFNEEQKELKQYLNLLALITMMYGITHDQAVKLYQITSATLLPNQPEKAQQNFAQYLSHVDDIGWYPLEPDVLGEYFVKQYLAVNGHGIEKNNKERHRQQLIDIGWQVRPWGIADFIVRYWQDYGEDDMFTSFMTPSQSIITDDTAINLSRILAFVISKYSDTEYTIVKAEEKYNNLKQLADNYAENPLVITQLAMAARTLIITYSERGDKQKTEEKYKDLKQLADDYPDNKEIVTRFSTATFTLIHDYSDKGDILNAESKYSTLKTYMEINPDDSAAKQLSYSNLKLIQHYLNNGNTIAVRNKYNDLRMLATQYPENTEVITCIAMTLSGPLIINYLDRAEEDKPTQVFEFLLDLVGKQPNNLEVVRELSYVAYRLILYKLEKRSNTSTEKEYAVLYNLANKHNENAEIAEKLLVTSVSLYIHYWKRGMLNDALKKWFRALQTDFNLISEEEIIRFSSIAIAYITWYNNLLEESLNNHGKSLLKATLATVVELGRVVNNQITSNNAQIAKQILDKINQED